MSFLDFSSIVSAVAWNYSTCQVFFFFFISGQLKLREPVVAWTSSTCLAFSAFLPSLALSLGFFVFISYSAEANQLPRFYQPFYLLWRGIIPRGSFFFLNYFWRVEVKVTCCTLEVFHELGFFCAFTLWFSCLAFLFLFSTALKLTSFQDFISILSALAWNYPLCQAFFFLFLGC